MHRGGIIPFRLTRGNYRLFNGGFLGQPPSAFVLLMYGRLTLGSAMAADRLVAEGDPDLISAFDRWLEGS